MKNNILVLIVEDDTELCDVLRFSLSVQGIPCVTAASVDEACSVLKARRIGLTLLDWKLERSGIEVLHLCRKLDPLMPVIVMSGIPLDVRTDAVLAEADGFLEKPFSPTVVVRHIERWLERLKATQTALPQREQDILHLEELKRRYIRHVVQLLDGNVSLAAERLRIHRHTVSAVLKNEDSEDSGRPTD